VHLVNRNFNKLSSDFVNLGFLAEDVNLEPIVPAFEQVFGQAQLDVPGFETLLRELMAAQPGVADELDARVCDGKTLRGSIAENNSGASCFIAQVSLYSQTVGVAISQITYTTVASGEIQALRLLLEAVELEGVMVQADALHANCLFSFTSPSAACPTS